MSRAIKVVLFDIYGTVIDPHKIAQHCETYYPAKGQAIAQIWREKQLQYSWLRSCMQRYRDFPAVTRDALEFACASVGAKISEDTIKKLLDAYKHLPLYDDALQGLKANHGKVYQAAFSNGPVTSLEEVLGHNKVLGVFDSLISVDEVKLYKPTPAAYGLVLDKTKAEREEVVLITSNFFDIAGAKAFGFRTVWVNRSGGPMDRLGFVPDVVVKDIPGAVEWVHTCNAQSGAN